MATMGKSILAAKLGDKVKKAVLSHKDDETKYDAGGSLPAGIENGVAQLTECKFMEIEKEGENKGKVMFIAAGIIVSPEVHTDGTPLKGRRTSINEFIFDTPTRSRKTVDDHMAWVMNTMRCLGAETSNVSSGEEIEQLAESLKQAGPYFTFRTWKGQVQTTGVYAGKEPKVNESWGKAINWDGGEAQDAKSAVVDNTPKGGVEDDTPAEEPVEEPAADADEAAYDVDALVEAEDGDKLTEIALSLGCTQKEVEKAADWAAVGEMIKAKQGGDETSADEEPAADEPTIPEAGEVYKYQLVDVKGKPVLDPKTKKPKKPIDVEVVKVDPKTSTVTLKDLDTKKAITGADPKVALKVPFDKLITQ